MNSVQSSSELIVGAGSTYVQLLKTCTLIHAAFRVAQCHNRDLRRLYAKERKSLMN